MHENSNEYSSIQNACFLLDCRGFYKNSEQGTLQLFVQHPIASRYRRIFKNWWILLFNSNASVFIEERREMNDKHMQNKWLSERKIEYSSISNTCFFNSYLCSGIKRKKNYSLFFEKHCTHGGFEEHAMKTKSTVVQM